VTATQENWLRESVGEAQRWRVKGGVLEGS